MTHSPIGSISPPCSAIGMKIAGGIGFPVAVVEPDQRFRADDAAALGRADGLVVEREFIGLERLANPQLDVPPLGRRVGQCFMEPAVAVAAGLLRFVHRDVGVLDQTLMVASVLGVACDAYAAADDVAVAADLAGGADRFLDAQREHVDRGHVEVGQRLEQQEFVSPEADQKLVPLGQILEAWPPESSGSRRRPSGRRCR